MTKESWVPLELQGFLVYLAPPDKMGYQVLLAPKESLVDLLLRVKEVLLGTQVCQVYQEMWGPWALLVSALQAQQVKKAYKVWQETQASQEYQVLKVSQVKP